MVLASSAASATVMEPINNDNNACVVNTSAPSHATISLAQLNSRLSGHSYYFIREVQHLFDSVESIEWTKLLQWTLQLPSNSTFARDERNHIFEALKNLFVEAGREFAQRLIDESS
jgi:hypothetical protein